MADERDDFEHGFRECKEGYLIPLQARLQEWLINNRPVIPIESWTELYKMLLASSEHPKEWEIK